MKHNKRRSCQNKSKYKTLKDARTTANNIEKRVNKPIYPYRCEFCGSIHLTKMPQPKRKLKALEESCLSI